MRLPTVRQLTEERRVVMHALGGVQPVLLQGFEGPPHGGRKQRVFVERGLWHGVEYMYHPRPPCAVPSLGS
eukprot:3340479-Prymnesium_polylepis.3